MAADNNQASPSSNPIGTESDTSQQGWLELDQQGLGGETLKAKKWTTQRRVVDSSQHVGNIHTGTEKAVELDKTSTLTEDTLQNQTLQEDKTSEDIERGDLNYQTSANTTPSAENFTQDTDQDANQSTVTTRQEDEQKSVVQSSGDDPLVFEKHFDTDPDDRSSQRDQNESSATQQADLAQTVTELVEETSPDPATAETTRATPPPTTPIIPEPVTSTPPQPLSEEEGIEEIGITPVESSASAPTLNAVDSHGVEDTAIAIELSSSLTDTDGSESLSITIEGIPIGATLSAGENLGNGTWKLTSDELTDLTLSPPTNSDEDFSLTITSTSTESRGGATNSVSEVIDVFLEAVADAPLLAADKAQGDEDTAISLNITSALTDTDGSETLSSIIISNVPEDATLSAGSKNDDGSWTLNSDDLENLKITPGPNNNDDFELALSVTATDSNGSTATSNIVLAITVNDVNDVPTLTVESTKSVDEDGSTTITFTTADSDGQIVETTATADHGTVTVNENNTISYTPDADYNGADTISVTTKDDDGATVTKTSSITVNDVNDAPTLTIESTKSVDEDGSTTITFAAADSDGQIVETTATADHGTVTVNEDNTISYTPDADYNGADTISVTTKDDDGATVTKTSAITVNDVNDAPTLTVESTKSVDEDGGTTITFAAADSDGQIVETTATADHGTVIVNEDNTISYTPDADYNGADTISVTTKDDDGATVTKTSSITVNDVNDAPTLTVESTKSVDEDGSTSITFAAADSDGQIVETTATAEHGTVTVNEDNTISYTPDADYNGADTISVTTKDDDGATVTQTSAITVNDVNDAPVSTDDSATTSEDNSITVNVLANDTDSNNDSLTITAVNPPTDADGNVIGSTEIVTENGVQQVKFTPNGTLDALNEGESSNIQFTYTVSDGQGGTDTATTTIEVQGTDNDLTYISETAGYKNVVGIYEIDGDGNPVSGTVVIDDQNGMAGGTHLADLEPGNYEFFIIANGANEINDDSAISFDTSGERPVLLIDGEPASHPVYYTEPTFNSDGKDHFQFESDGEGGTFVNIEDLPNLGDADFGDVVLHTNFEMEDRIANDAPVGTDDSATTSEDNSITVNVLANDTDSNNDSLTITAVNSPTDADGNVIGSTEIVTENGVQQVKFTPNGTLDALNDGESSNIQFTYTVSDGQGGTDTATTTIEVQGTDNDLTYISETAGYRNVVGTYEIDDDGNPVSGTVVIDDQNGMAGGTHLADLEPGNHEFFIIANGANEINDDSVISFDNSGDQPVLLINGEPASHPVYYTEPSFNTDGKDHFQFESDGEGGTFVNIEDLPNLGDADFGDVVLHTNFEMEDRIVNDAPVSTDDSATTSEDNSITVNVLANDTDSNNDSLTITAVNSPTDADGNVVGSTEIVTENGVQQVKFTPNGTLDALNEGESSNIQFTYTVSDGQGGTDTATTTIEVQGTDNDLTYISETAGYRNVVGTYEVDGDGNPVSGTVVIDDQNGMAGGTHLADLEPGNYEFFIIANGANEINDDSAISFDNSGDQPVLLINGEPASHPVYYTEPGFNSDGKDHFQFESDGEGGTFVNIEDLPDLGDADFGDVVLHTNFEMEDRIVDITPPAAPTIDLTTSSDTGASNADDITNDRTPTITGTTEAGATVVITDTNGKEWGTGEADDNGEYSITTSTQNHGEHTLTVTATDSAGNSSTATQNITIDTTATITVDTEFVEGQSNVLNYDSEGARNANNKTFNNLTEALDGQNGTNHDAGNLVYKNVNGTTWNLDGTSDDHMVITGNSNNADIALGDGNNTLVFETDPGKNVTVNCGSGADLIVLPGNQSDYNLGSLNNNNGTLNGQITGPDNMNMTVNNIDCISFGDGTALGDSSLSPDGDDTLIVTGTTTDVDPGQLISISVTDSTDTTVTAQGTVSDDGSYAVDVNVNSLADGNLSTDVTVTDIAGNIATKSDTDITSAQLIDGIVEGIEFTTTSGLHGYTEADGNFSFRDGDEITFNVGGVTLGTATAEDVVSGQTFLQDIADVDRTDLNDEYLENMATFLQSIDENSDAYDGIVVTEEIREALADADIDLRTASGEEVEQLVEQIGLNYVEENAAMDHVQDMLVEHTDLTHEEFDEHIDDDLSESNNSVSASAAVTAEATDSAVQDFNDTNSTDLSLSIPSLTLPGEEEDGESSSQEPEAVQADKQETAVQDQNEAADAAGTDGQQQTDILADDDLTNSLPDTSLSNLFDESVSSDNDESTQTETGHDSEKQDDGTPEQVTAQTEDPATPMIPPGDETTAAQDMTPEPTETAEVLNEETTVDEDLSLSTDELSIDLSSDSENETMQEDQGEDTSLDRFTADGSSEQTETNGLDQFSANDATGSTEEMASVDEIDNAEAESADEIEAAGLSADDGIQEELPQESEQVDTNIG